MLAESLRCDLRAKRRYLISHEKFTRFYDPLHFCFCFLFECYIQTFLASFLILESHFGDRTYTFDKKSAIFYADIRQQRTKLGLPISHADCQIAAITCQYGCTLVTRNTKDFQKIEGLTLLNPFA